VKHLIALFLSAVLFIGGIYSLYKPLGRELIPRVAPFFIGEQGIWGIIKLATEKEADSISISGIDEKVSIARDKFGTAHIYAKSYEDALFGLGYITAKDRIFQIELINRLVSGSLSEWFGPSYTEIDKFMLNLGLDRAASNLMQKASNSNEYELLRIYSNGVNAFISNKFEKIPSFEYALLGLPNKYNRPLDGIKTLMFLHFIMNWSMDDFYIQQIVNQTGDKLFSDLFFKHLNSVKLPNGETVIPFKPAAISVQNKSFVNTMDWMQKQSNLLEFLSGWKSGVYNANTVVISDDNGNSMMSNTLFGPLSQPSLLYEVYFHLSGKTIHGFTVPGLPGILFGANESIAWSINQSPADIVDYAIVTDEQIEYKETPNTIQVKDGNTISYPIRFTENGTLFYSGNEIIEMKWPVHDVGFFAVYLKDAILSNTIEDVHANLSKAHLPVMSITSISEKKAGYFTSGKIPIRSNYLGITNASTGLENSKYINSKLTIKSKKERLVITDQLLTNNENRDFPYFSREGFWRNNRLEKLVSNLKSPIPITTIEKLFLDYRMQEIELKPILTDLFKGRLTSPVNSLGNALRDWNYEANKDSGYPKFYSNLEKIIKPLIFDEFSVRFFPDNESIYRMIINENNNPIFDNKQTPEREDAEEIFYAALSSSLELSVLESGAPENWTWAVSNRADLRHISNNKIMNQLNDLSVVREGFLNTVNKSGDGIFPISSISKFSSWFEKGKMKTKGLIFSGSSANRYTPYYENQLSLWASGELKPIFEYQVFDSLKINGFIQFNVHD